MNLQKYNKTLVAVVGVVLTCLNAVYGTNPYVQAAISVATALGVYQVKNQPGVQQPTNFKPPTIK